MTIQSISNESECQAALAAIEPFLQKGFDNLTLEEDEELAGITSLIEDYEAMQFPLPFLTYLNSNNYAL